MSLTLVDLISTYFSLEGVFFHQNFVGKSHLCRYFIIILPKLVCNDTAKVKIYISMCSTIYFVNLLPLKPKCGLNRSDGSKLLNDPNPITWLDK